MKNRGTLITFSIVLAIVCLYQLSFTFKTRSFEAKAKKWATKVAKTTGTKEAVNYRRYLDSLGSSPIYNLGVVKYSYFDCKQKEINLGLDLRGGMNVILEVDKAAIIRGMANDRTNPQLLKALELSNKEITENGGDFVNEFVKAYKNQNPPVAMINLFASKDNAALGNTTTESSLIQYINTEVNSSIGRVKEVVEKRINQSNVTQPTIQTIDNGRISVELPGVDNPKRIEDLLEKSANLEFFEVYANFEGLREGDAIMNRLLSVNGSTNVIDTTVKKDTTVKAASIGTSPLLNYITQTKGATAAGLVKGSDIKRITELLSTPAYQKELMLSKASFAFSAKPATYNKAMQPVTVSNEYEIYFLRLNREGNSSLNSENGNIITNAVPTTDNNGQIVVSMSMTPEASNEWAKVTGANINKPIAIVLDNRVYSAPNVNDKITGGNSQISGNFDVTEAEDLANVLKAGKLPAPAKIVASEVVGPTLGDASIKRGTSSLFIGFILVLVFMALYYRQAGLIAIIAVLANVFIMVSVLASLGAALTLPGIAGVLLTIGMAVDSNVLIFERIKEELAQGKSLKTAVTDGYKYALSAIVDSNLTALLAGLILLMAGSGPAYGFAIILVIGIFSSMFTALLIARLIIDTRINKGKSISFDTSWNRGFLKNKNYDFVGNRRKFYLIASSTFIIGTLAIIFKGGLSTGIDFKGGNSFIMQFEPSKKYSTEDIKETLDLGLKGSSNEVKTFGSDGQYRIVTTYLLSEDSKEAREKAAGDVTNVLKSKFVLKNVNGSPILSSSKIGQAVATNIRNKSTLLLALAIFGMFLYILLRFRSINYGLGATVALIHDIFFVFTIFMLLDGVVPFPIEFDQHLIAALLTLVGYSMNDTVIVFDRIREYLANNKSADATDGKLINMAINSTLSRTLITASTVFLVLLTLFFFGGDSLKGFSLAMLVGVLVGTYSSICIATPIVVDFASKKKKG